MKPRFLHTLLVCMLTLCTSMTIWAQCNNDTEPPVITCLANVTGLQCGDPIPIGYSDSTSFVNAGGGITENCRILSLTYVDDKDPSTFTFCGTLDTFIVTRMYIATDVGNNRDTCFQTFTYQDTDPPVFDCPVSLTINLSTDAVGACTGYNTALEPTAVSDNCTSATFTYTLSGATNGTYILGQDPIEFNLGLTNVELVGNDCMNNSTAPCLFTVTVVDDVAPVFNCPTDIVVPTDPNSCDAVVDFVISANDGCEGAIPDANISQTVGLPTGSTFPLGMTPMEFTTQDSEGNIATCNFNVIVLDQEIPVVMDCPLDMEFDLRPNQCDTTVIFFPPFATDNCTNPVTDIVRIDVSGLNSDDPFPVGETVIAWQISDANGNRDTCSFTVTVNEHENPTTNCGGHYNLSVDENCSAALTPEMVLEGNNYGCIDLCDISVTNSNGEEVPNSFGSNDVGETFTYSICCQGICCWGTVTIEDYYPPSFQTCVSDTVTCSEFMDLAKPLTTDNCVNPEPKLINEVELDVSCTDPILSKIVTRSYVVLDRDGTPTDTCTQELSVRKLDINTVQPPALSNIDLVCGANYPKIDASEYPEYVGHPSPDFYGSPRINGVNIYGGQFEDCKVFSKFEDERYDYGPEVVIVRKWTIFTCYCLTTEERFFMQRFSIKDEQGPSFVCPQDIETTVQNLNCTAEVVLPPVHATDACGSIGKYSITWNNGSLNSNGGLASFEKGSTEVLYTVTDEYGNSSTCTMHVIVKDDLEPVAIADLHTTIGVNNQGVAFLTADMVDDGSYDACSPVELYVKRMDNGASCDAVDLYPPNGDDNVEWNDGVHFCCADVGQTIMVQFMACDDANMDGIFNSPGDNCAQVMVEVEVFDKIAPVLVSNLPDVTVSCGYPVDQNNLQEFGKIATSPAEQDVINVSDPNVLYSTPNPKDALIIDNCGDLISDNLVAINYNGECGQGTYRRTLRFGDSNGYIQDVYQYITVQDFDPFDKNDIVFPKDIDFYNEPCGLDIFNVENLPAGFDKPILSNTGCTKLGVSRVDSVYDGSYGSLSCVVIKRYWTVADWCQKSSSITKQWSQVQTLRSFNTIAPVITGACEDITISSYDVNCGPILVNITQTAQDECTAAEHLEWTFTVDLDSDGSIDDFGNSNTINKSYPIGTHTVEWIVNDGCGNSDTCSYSIVLENLKQPTPICNDSLAIAVEGVDYDGDGVLDDEVAIIHVDTINNKSYPACYPIVDYSFSTNTSDKTRLFNCDSLGFRTVSMYVTDSHGNQDFCTAVIEIQDNNTDNVCPEQQITASIQGSVYDLNKQMIKDVNVKLFGGEIDKKTDDSGTYSFGSMPIGGTYEVQPTLNVDAVNGVSTLDLITIQKHILGIKELDDPKKMIAADVNSSGTITGSDIIAIRKVILGIDNAFPNTPSWTFVTAEYQFPDVTNPWSSLYPTNYSIDLLTEDMIVDFYAIKTGDVNGTAQTNVDQEDVTVRSSSIMNLNWTNQESEDSWIPVYAESDALIHGFQGAFSTYNGVEIMNVRSSFIDQEMISFNSNSIRFAAHWEEAIGFDGSQVLFEVKVKQDAQENFALRPVADILPIEAYDNSLELVDIQLGVTITNTSKEAISEVEVLQNVPNPWSNFTQFTILSPMAQDGTYRLIDEMGAVLEARKLKLHEGKNIVSIDGSNFNASGVVYYEVTIGNQTWLKKTVRLR